MSGLLGYAAAGALAGAGKGLIEDAKAARERTMEELRFARQRALAQEDRDFRAGQADLDRQFRTSEREATQEFTASENAAQRSHSAGVAAAGRALQERLAIMADERQREEFAARREQWAAEFGLKRDAYADARTDRAEDVEFRDRSFDATRADRAEDVAARDRAFDAGRADRGQDVEFRDRAFDAGRTDRAEDVEDRNRRTGLLETSEDRQNRLADRAIQKPDETFTAPDGRRMGLFGTEARPITTPDGAPVRADTTGGLTMPDPIMDPALPFASAVGAGGNIADIANTVVGMFAPVTGAGIPAPEINAAREQLRNLGVQTQTMLQDAVPGRPSNYLMQMLGNMTVDPNSWTQNPEQARQRAIQTRAVIRRGIDENLAIIRNPSGYSPSDVSKARQSLQSLGGLYADYGVLVDSLTAADAQRRQSARQPEASPGNGRRSQNSRTQAAPSGAPQVGDVLDGYRFKGGNPADPASWEPVR